MSPNYPYAWKFDILPDMYFYQNQWQPSPFKLGKGNKINEGDTFYITLHFIPHTDLKELFVLLHDFTLPDNGAFSTDISRHCFLGNFKAGTEYKVGGYLTATKDAGSADPNANVLTIYAEADTQPVILFTKIDIVNSTNETNIVKK